MTQEELAIWWYEIFLSFKLIWLISRIYDLASNCSTLTNKDKFIELKTLFSKPNGASQSDCSLTDKKFGLEYVANPKKKVDPLTIKLLIDNPQNQFNLVCNVLMEVCGVSCLVICICMLD